MARRYKSYSIDHDDPKQSAATFTPATTVVADAAGATGVDVSSLLMRVEKTGTAPDTYRSYLMHGYNAP